MGELPQPKVSAGRPTDSTDKHLAKANNLLAELDREEKSGFNLRESQDDDFDMGLPEEKGADKSGKSAGNLSGDISKEEQSHEMVDNYDDDFDDDIEEDLPADQNDYDDADLNARSANVAGSG